MKRWALLAATLILVACSPKGTVIPADPTKWDTIQKQAQSLSQEDRRLLAAYMVRQSLAGAFSGGKPNIPAGTTIGKAITDQQKFEADATKAQLDEQITKAKAAAARAKAEAALNDAVILTVIGKTYIPKNIYAERFSDNVQFVIAVHNRTQKDISGIKGAIQFDDMFGSQIKSVNVSMDDAKIGAGKIYTTSNYSIELNQFNQDDSKLAGTDLAKMKVTFHPEMIIFADGTKMTVPTETETP